MVSLWPERILPFAKPVELHKPDKHIVADCLMYDKERDDHRISYQLDTALGPNQEKILDIINFIKQTKFY